MGYFSNGTEGESYYERYCAKCVHDGDGWNDPYCPVWAAHKAFNYDECNNKDSILHMLIPRCKDGGNDKCLMFVERDTTGDFFSPTRGWIKSEQRPSPRSQE